MKSGSAPQTTKSSTTIATKSSPIVSYLPNQRAISVLVPTPSVEVASNGLDIFFNADASNKPAKPPSSLTTSLRRDLAMDAFINSTARSPASISTPASL